jgi:EpsI family protein
MILKPLVAFGFLAANLYVYHGFARVQVIPPREAFAQFPLKLGDWSCPRREFMDDKTLRNLGASDYLICDYSEPEAATPVGVYVGYHEAQIREEGGGDVQNSIHTPKHCMPGSGWDIIGHSVVELDAPGLPQRPAPVNRMVIAKGDARQLVYYWYQTQGRVIADDWQKIAYLSWDRAWSSRTDGALVRFTTTILRKDEEAADRTIRQLANEIVPLLPAYVPGS